jgi:hypothetical protein
LNSNSTSQKSLGEESIIDQDNQEEKNQIVKLNKEKAKEKSNKKEEDNQIDYQS